MNFQITVKNILFPMVEVFHGKVCTFSFEMSSEVSSGFVSVLAFLLSPFSRLPTSYQISYLTFILFFTSFCCHLYIFRFPLLVFITLPFSL